MRKKKWSGKKKLSLSFFHLDPEVGLADDVLLLCVELGSLFDCERFIEREREEEKKKGVREEGRKSSPPPWGRGMPFFSPKSLPFLPLRALALKREREDRALRSKERETRERKKTEKTPLTLAINVPQVPHRIDIGSIILTLSMLRSAFVPRGTFDGSKSGG